MEFTEFRHFPNVRLVEKREIDVDPEAETTETSLLLDRFTGGNGTMISYTSTSLGSSIKDEVSHEAKITNNQVLFNLNLHTKGLASDTVILSFKGSSGRCLAPKTILREAQKVVVLLIYIPSIPRGLPRVQESEISVDDVANSSRSDHEDLICSPGSAMGSTQGASPVSSSTSIVARAKAPTPQVDSACGIDENRQFILMMQEMVDDFVERTRKSC